MSDKTNGTGKVTGIETKHFVKLMSNGQRSINMPIRDRASVPALDPMYDQYQLFTRIIVTVDYNGSEETLKSGQLDVSEPQKNPAAEG
jgi:hypothetical protein